MARLTPPALDALVHPTVSVVICAYTEERWNDIVAAVESVRAQARPALETILVADNNPALLDRIGVGIDGVIATPNVEARGLSGARNSGVAVARGDVVAFLDDDAWAEPDWLTHLAAAYGEPDVVGAGGGIAPAWQTARPRWWPDEFDWVIGCSYRGLPRERSEVRNPIGANMSFLRSALQIAGPFSHRMGRIGTRPLGGEETELAVRVRRSVPGGRILYEPKARVNHRVPASRGTARYFLDRCYAEGLSKAVMTKLVGAETLSSERSYTLRTLPAGVVRHSLDVLRRRDPFGLLRASWIVIGLAATTSGYVVGSRSALSARGGSLR